ncbi:MAG TPA: RluA family pseudouridine synthase [Candidatus Polarisedimenticolia bacterium]|nr:RluA family pseudouridine synthase [Candidatus Polarisedimenticolia bacterium]
MPGPGPGDGERRMSIRVPEERQGERIDQVLAALLSQQSRAAVQRLIRERQVLLRGEPVRAAYRVRGGETIDVSLPPPRPSCLEAEPYPLDILFEDGDLVVINKPAGMTVHPGAGARSGTLVNALLHHCSDLSGIGGEERPGIVHRLDRDTTGALVVAKNDLAHRDLAAQFKARTVGKQYEALVWGCPRFTSGSIDKPIGRHRTARVRMAIRPEGRSARTAWKILAPLGPVALLELEPATGRTHQIRVHLMSIGHPIVGDPLYGGRRAGGAGDRAAQRSLAAFSGLALHARRLAFRHPRSGVRVECCAPRPPGLQQLISALGGPADTIEAPAGRRS